jgi:hypothetical protein
MCYRVGLYLDLVEFLTRLSFGARLYGSTRSCFWYANAIQAPFPVLFALVFHPTVIHALCACSLW